MDNELLRAFKSSEGDSYIFFNNFHVDFIKLRLHFNEHFPATQTFLKMGIIIEIFWDCFYTPKPMPFNSQVGATAVVMVPAFHELL